MTETKQQKIERLRREIEGHKISIAEGEMKILQMKRNIAKRMDNQVWLEEALQNYFLPLWYIRWRIEHKNKGL